MTLLAAEGVGIAYGTRTVLDGVTLGVAAGDRIGVVGLNGGGKSTLLRVLAGDEQPDAGRVIRVGGLRVARLAQHDALDPAWTVRHAVVGDAPDHVWRGDPRARALIEGFVGDLDLDAPVGPLSGGERRRVALAALLADDHDVLLLDEPTNHLDVESVALLARVVAESKAATVVVTHDRWFLDEVCTRTWEVADGQVHGYEGGYAAWVLARAERGRVAAESEARRQNLLRKELAWLRRGPPARTSKPRYRIDAANALIADEPPPRDRAELRVVRLVPAGAHGAGARGGDAVGGPGGGAARRHLAARPGRPGRRARPQRLGQDHPAARARRGAPADRRAGRPGAHRAQRLALPGAR